MMKLSTATSSKASAQQLVPPKRIVRARALQGGKPVDPTPVVGERIAKWLATPFDLAAFPARAGIGAVVSMPDRASSLQSDWQRLVELVQDPRPVEEKQDVLRKELEDTVLEFLEKGTVIEQDVLSNIKSILPVDAANAITELIPDPPNKVPQAGPVVPVEEGDINSLHPEEEQQPGSTVHMTYTVTSDDSTKLN